MTREYKKPGIEQSKNRISVSISKEGRKIEFEKECFGNIKVFRQVNNQDWLCIAQNVRSPYIDSDNIIVPSVIKYYVVLLDDHGNETTSEEFEIRV